VDWIFGWPVKCPELRVVNQHPRVVYVACEANEIVAASNSIQAKGIVIGASTSSHKWRNSSHLELIRKLRRKSFIQYQFHHLTTIFLLLLLVVYHYFPYPVTILHNPYHEETTSSTFHQRWILEVARRNSLKLLPNTLLDVVGEKLTKRPHSIHQKKPAVAKHHRWFTEVHGGFREDSWRPFLGARVVDAHIAYRVASSDWRREGSSSDRRRCGGVHSEDLVSRCSLVVRHSEVIDHLLGMRR